MVRRMLACGCVVLENVREGSVADADVRNACVVDGV